jgi:hypothetical protein
MTSVFSDADHARYIAGHWPEIGAAMFDRLVDFRERHPEAQFIDVHYKDLTADPLKVVHRIYESFDLALTPSTEALMRDHVAREKQHKYGQHVYSLSELRLTRAPLEARFVKYLDRFNIQAEPV